jgi:hypothetical protein
MGKNPWSYKAFYIGLAKRRIVHLAINLAKKYNKAHSQFVK